MVSNRIELEQLNAKMKLGAWLRNHSILHVKLAQTQLTNKLARKAAGPNCPEPIPNNPALQVQIFDHYAGVKRAGKNNAVKAGVAIFLRIVILEKPEEPTSCSAHDEIKRYGVSCIIQN